MPKQPKLSRGDKRKDSRGQKKVVAAEIADEVLRTEAAPKPDAAPVAAPEAEAAPVAAPEAEPAPSVEAQARKPRLVAAKQRAEAAPPEAPASRAVNLPVAVTVAAKPVEQAFARSVETWQRSMQAAGRTAVTVNCALLGLAQETMNSSLELARDLASARTPVEAARLQLGFWQDWLDVCESHNKALREVALELVAHARAPVRGELRS